MSIDINDIAGPEGDSFKFAEPGDTAKGIIVGAEKLMRENQFNGKLEQVLRIALEQEDGATTIIWPVTCTEVDAEGEPMPGSYAPKQAKAIAAAVRSAGATSLEDGATLAVRYDKDGTAEAGRNAPKLYVAEYQPPAATTNGDSSDDVDGAVKGLI